MQFNEESLRNEIIKTWGEAGAHLDVYDELLKRYRKAEKLINACHAIEDDINDAPFSKALAEFEKTYSPQSSPRLQEAAEWVRAEDGFTKDDMWAAYLVGANSKIENVTSKDNFNNWMNEAIFSK